MITDLDKKHYYEKKKTSLKTNFLMYLKVIFNEPGLLHKILLHKIENLFFFVALSTLMYKVYYNYY